MNFKFAQVKIFSLRTRVAKKSCGMVEVKIINFQGRCSSVKWFLNQLSFPPPHTRVSLLMLLGTMERESLKMMG